MGVLLTFFNAVYWNSKGTNSLVTNFTGTSLTTSIVLYSASTQLGFCNLHRHFIVYDSIATLWIDIKDVFNPIIGLPLNVIIVSIGICLLIWLFVFLFQKQKKPRPV